MCGPPSDGCASANYFCGPLEAEDTFFSLTLRGGQHDFASVAMILGLPLEGIAVTGIIQTDGWRDMVEALIGIRPPEPPEGSRTGRPQGLARLG